MLEAVHHYACLLGAEHVLALLGAADNALAEEFLHQLDQPEVDGNWGRAYRCTVVAVRVPFVAENMTKGPGDEAGGWGLGCSVAWRADWAKWTLLLP